MTVSLDVILGTLVFLMPGFIAVGMYVALGRFFSRPDMTRGTFVLLSLALSVPLLLVFNALAPYVGWKLLVPLTIPTDNSQYVAPSFLLSLSVLYAICALLGSAVALGFNLFNSVRRKRRGLSHEISRLNVWTNVMGTRTQTPYVLAVLETSAYHGLLRQATTEDSDPYIYISKPDYVPLDASQRPDWQKRSPLKIDGILLQKADIKALWIVS